MLLSKKEKEKRVVELANQGKTTREIAKEVRVSKIYWKDFKQRNW
jgi:transposase